MALSILSHNCCFCSHNCSSIPQLPTLPDKNPPSSISLSSQIHSRTHLFKEACRQGSLGEAFLSFHSLSHQSPILLPSPEMYSSILELCAAQNALSQGQQIHAHILSSNFASGNGFLQTKLLFMYGKCGSLDGAQKLFDEMSDRTIFAWNALIGACASNQKPLEAIKLYVAMRESGILPDACTFASIIKACAELGDLLFGSEAHGLAIKCGLISTIFVVNALVTMYAKCCRFDQAMWLFLSLPEKSDVVSWNSIISACLQNGQCSEALGLFREMQKAGIGLNSYTIVGALQACAELLLLNLGTEIHAFLLKSNENLEIFESNALVVMYARCGKLGHAVQVFSQMSEQDNVSWNSLLSGYVQNMLYDKVIELLLKMQDAHCNVDQVSVINVASALGRLQNLSSGKALHAYAVRHKFDSNLQVGNTIMDMYSKCSCVQYAERIFCTMRDKDFISYSTAIACYSQNHSYLKALHLFRDVQMEGVKLDSMMVGSVLIACSGLNSVSHLKQIHCYTIRHGLLDLVVENTIIDAYGECGNVGYAFQVFKHIENKDVVSWTSMMDCYVQNGLLTESLDLFYDMEEANVELDGVALISILSTIAELSVLRKGKEVHGFLIRKGYSMDESIGNTLVDMYARCGSLDSCYKLFEGVRHKDLVLWTTMINASGMHGRGKEAIDLFRRMLETGLVPDHVTFLALLYACSHSGLPEAGKLYLDVMKSKYSLEPWPEHYACVVDLLGRSGQVDEAYEFVTSMPIEPTAAVWCSLLGACHVHSNSKLGKVAAHRLLELEPGNPGNYVLISNFFAAARKWNDMEEVRNRMKGMGLKKSPACSWIEMGNTVHSFIAGDPSHPESGEIFSKLYEITKQLERRAGYVANTSFVFHEVGEEQKVKKLYGHSERLAITYGLIGTREGTTLRITKNLRVCGDCHEFTKLVSNFFGRQIIVRDTNRFHHFKDGSCSCGDFW